MKLREKLRATRAAKAAALTTAVNDALNGFADPRFDEDDFHCLLYTSPSPRDS